MTLAFAPERIEHWPLDRLSPYARNARTHDADQVAKIAASMAEFGWTVPCLVGEDGELIAGHGRVLAAEQLGLTQLEQWFRTKAEHAPEKPMISAGVGQVLEVCGAKFFA